MSISKWDLWKNPNHPTKPNHRIRWDQTSVLCWWSCRSWQCLYKFMERISLEKVLFPLWREISPPETMHLMWLWLLFILKADSLLGLKCLFTLLVSRCASHWQFSEWRERWGRQRKCFRCRCPYGKKSHYVFVLPSYFPQASCLHNISQNISRSNQSFCTSFDLTLTYLCDQLFSR